MRSQASAGDHETGKACTECIATHTRRRLNPGPRFPPLQGPILKIEHLSPAARRRAVSACEEAVVALTAPILKGSAAAIAGISAVAGAITAADDARGDRLARRIRHGKTRLTFRLRRAARSQAGAETAGDVRWVDGANRIALRAVDDGTAAVVAGIDVAEPEPGAGLTHTVTGALATASSHALPADAIEARGAGRTVRVGRIDAVASGAAALARWTYRFAADLGVALKSGAADARGAVVVEVAAAAERESALAATGAFEIAITAGLSRAGWCRDAPAFLTRSIAAFADSSARDVTAAAVKAATSDAVRAGRACCPEVALRAHATTITVAEEAGGAKLLAAGSAAAHRGLAIIRAAICIHLASTTEHLEASLPAEALTAIPTAGLERIGNTRAALVAALAVAVASLLTAHAVDAG